LETTNADRVRRLEVALCQPATAAGGDRATWPRRKSCGQPPHSRISTPEFPPIYAQASDYMEQAVLKKGISPDISLFGVFQFVEYYRFG
jgi:hypothetical protein